MGGGGIKIMIRGEEKIIIVFLKKKNNRWISPIPYYK